MDNFYYKYINRSLPITDQLASARSILANERTFLSYQRSALTFAVAGLSIIKFIDILWIVIIGWLFLPASVILLFSGIYRYLKMRDYIKNINKNIQEQISKNRVIEDLTIIDS